MDEYWLCYNQIERIIWGFPGGSVVKNLPANAGDMDSIPDREDLISLRATKPTHHIYWVCAPEPRNCN